jgi:hypothetical protein
MDTVITFPTPEPALKLARPSAEKWAATLAEERLRLQEDQEALRERESNLREYESRLRSLQADIEAGRTIPPTAAAAATPATTPPTSTRSTTPHFQRPTSRAPFIDDAGLQSAWEKLHRAHELLESEHKNMRDERISMRELEVTLKRRQEDLAEREARVVEREALIVAAAGGSSQRTNVEGSVSAVTRFTRAPFDMARSVFGGKRAG